MKGVYNEAAPGATSQGCVLCMPHHAKQILLMLLLSGIQCDTSCLQVLEAAGITDPLVLAVAYTARARRCATTPTHSSRAAQTLALQACVNCRCCPDGILS